MACWFGGSLSKSGNVTNLYENTSPTSPFCWEGQLDDDCLLQKAFFNTSTLEVSANQGDKKQRIADLKNLIKTTADSSQALQALGELYAILRSDYRVNALRERSGFYPFLQQVKSERTEKKLAGLVQQYMIIWKMLEKDYPAAINLCKQALKTAQGDDYMAILAYLIQLHINSGELDQAETYLSEYRAKYNFDEDGIFLFETELQRVSGNPVRLQKNQPANENMSKGGDEFVLHAYPNPFNPTTRISYELDRGQTVKIRVFDILGREVKTLYNGTNTRGAHSIVWDAKDKYGNVAPSGVYLINLVTENNSKTIKVLLVK